MADACEPDRGHQREQRRKRAIGLGTGQSKGQERADRQRCHQLGQRRELETIVEDADDEHGQGRQRNRIPVRRRRQEFRTRRDHRKPCDGARRNRQTSHRRRRGRVPAVGPRRDDRTARLSKPSDHRAARDAAGSGDNKHTREEHQHGDLTMATRGACQFRQRRLRCV